MAILYYSQGAVRSCIVTMHFPQFSFIMTKRKSAPMKSFLCMFDPIFLAEWEHFTCTSGKALNYAALTTVVIKD